MKSNKLSIFSDINWYDQMKGLPIGPYSPGETWHCDMPTRSDTTKYVNNEGLVIPLFGDSFIFGQGLRHDETIEANLSKLDPKNCYLNFSNPGSSNVDILMRLEQWINTHQDSPVIFVGLTDGLRDTIYFNNEYAQIGDKSDNSIFDNNNQFIEKLLPNREISHERIRTSRFPELFKYAKQQWEHYYQYQVTPVTNLMNLQLAIKRLYWISRATNIPIYYRLPQELLYSFNRQDKIHFSQQLSELEQSSDLRRIKNILPNIRNYWMSDTDAHWNAEGTSIASNNIWKNINVHI